MERWGVGVAVVPSAGASVAAYVSSVRLSFLGILAQPVTPEGTLSIDCTLVEGVEDLYDAKHREGRVMASLLSVKSGAF